MAEPYLTRLRETIENLDIGSDFELVLEFKHFFSGAALYANGKICATLTPAGFGLKLPIQIRNVLIDASEGSELRIFDNAPIKKEYVALSRVVIEDPDRLKILIRQCIEYVISMG